MFRTTAILLTVLVGADPAASNPLDGVVEVDILPGWRTNQGTHMSGLQIRLADGWKTYWRAPGDAGIPPMFDWSGSENIAGVAFHWPVPEVSWSNGMRSIVYEDVVVIPMEFALVDGNQPTRALADVQLGVCDDICVPVNLSIDAALTAQGGPDPQILAAIIDRPRTAQEAGVNGVSCDVRPAEGGLIVTARIDMPLTHDDPEVVIEAGNQEVWVSDPMTRRDGNSLLAEARMIHATGGAFALDRSAMRITVFDGEDAIDIQGCAAG